ncbi:hypothetical protein WA026_016963 [Henosepilachna vigintioctopunctata]|uniref:Uncharacterized protein n=1 Tax=Henosepilachna vigintioctopunctata TaxID=420089 RepID=A0AAW1U8H7_9CUCU
MPKRKIVNRKCLLYKLLSLFLFHLVFQSIYLLQSVFLNNFYLSLEACFHQPTVVNSPRTSLIEHSCLLQELVSQWRQHFILKNKYENKPCTFLNCIFRSEIIRNGTEILITKSFNYVSTSLKLKTIRIPVFTFSEELVEYGHFD